MGKYILLVVAAVMAGSSTLMFQSQTTSLDTDQRQAQRQEKVIARQIARTGYNAVLAEARTLEAQGKDAGEIVSDVGTISGDYQGGTYTARLEQISPTAFRAISVGELRTAAFSIGESGDSLISHKIEDSHERNTMPSGSTPTSPVAAPAVEEPSNLKVTFIESMAGYCSAVYLKRILPGVSSENQPEPELIFAPGNDRDGESAEYERAIVPGTKLNFLLAVDADYSCEAEGDTTVRPSDDTFDYVRESFTQNISEVDKVHEAPYALIEAGSTSENWRVAFEDLIFDKEKLWDIKENGYPGSDSESEWDPESETYGGDGWNTESSGFYDLEDYGNVPDFSDQVIAVEILPDNSGGSTPYTYVDAAHSNTVTVSATKDLSNLIWQYQSGAWKKIEDLSGHTYEIPNGEGDPIEHVWIKSGSNFTDSEDPTAPSNGAGEYHAVNY